MFKLFVLFFFADRVRACDGKVLVHCVGGVSRSATIAVGYVMRYMHLSLDNAYRYVQCLVEFLFSFNRLN